MAVNSQLTFGGGAFFDPKSMFISFTAPRPSSLNPRAGLATVAAVRGAAWVHGQKAASRLATFDVASLL